jgi:hypothetical protein
VNLYRIMTDVRAGSHQRRLAADDLGIVTLWVRATSEDIALARAKFILTNRRYASMGQLHLYAETVANDSLAYVTDDADAADRREDRLLAGYDAMREQALAQADGLLEVWLTPSDEQLVRNRQIA